MYPVRRWHLIKEWRWVDWLVGWRDFVKVRTLFPGFGGFVEEVGRGMDACVSSIGGETISLNGKRPKVVFLRTLDDLAVRRRPARTLFFLMGLETFFSPRHGVLSCRPRSPFHEWKSFSYQDRLVALLLDDFPRIPTGRYLRY